MTRGTGIGRGLLLAVVAALASVGCGRASRDGDPRITDLLAPIVARHRVPAMAAAIVSSRGVEAVGVVGVRKWGSREAATLDDLWHLGSETKAMTAALAGRLVERGLLSWDTKVEELFPELAEGFDPVLKEVTLLHLLSHRAGVPVGLTWSTLRGDTVGEKRVDAVRRALQGPALSLPGSQYLYSNLGYVVVGAMIERVLATSWETSIRREIFAPLSMRSAGFGGLGTPGKTDQPWGHPAPRKPSAANGPESDMAAVLGPAGRVHATVQDWAAFIADQLRGDRGTGGILAPDTYRALHTPPFGGGYALGWEVTRRDWGGGTVYTHIGTNTEYYATVWMAPERDFALLVCTNLGSEVSAAVDLAVSGLIRIRLSG